MQLHPNTDLTTYTTPSFQSPFPSPLSTITQSRLASPPSPPRTPASLPDTHPKYFIDSKHFPRKDWKNGKGNAVDTKSAFASWAVSIINQNRKAYRQIKFGLQATYNEASRCHPHETLTTNVSLIILRADGRSGWRMRRRWLSGGKRGVGRIVI
ncbi:unnamed protein product [Acanthosepion pharaonis]|uniref:Uncharacterized protein n=1 Tax=Acanthosepion pharaonis TaxID=158019 RepID=A0A812EEU4_ACAPH|nr:unnamed protein product [Sepia pharaonis]